VLFDTIRNPLWNDEVLPVGISDDVGEAVTVQAVREKSLL